MENIPRNIMLHPGKVRSISDGDIHDIGVSQLIELYKIRPTDGVVVFDQSNPTHTQEYEVRHSIGRVHLYPKEDGAYFDIHDHSLNPKPL